MALKATVFKAELTVADMDRHYYADHALTLARHPSETDERMMVRLLAFALNADPTLAFGKGLSNDEEPDLWQKDLTGEIQHWIELGQPDERLIRRACGRSTRVSVYCYSGNSARVWWQQTGDKLDKLANLAVYEVSSSCAAALAALSQRSMQLTCTVQDGQAWFADEASSVAVELTVLKAPA